MQLSLKGTGLLELGKSLAWTRRNREQLRAAVARGMTRSGRVITTRVQQDVRSSLNVKRPGFVKSYRMRVYSSKPGRMPSMAIGSKGHFTGILERGGTVRAKKRLLLIPFGNLRIGPKAFRTLIRNLMARGDGFFRKVNGTLILFAENMAENDRDLRRFKRVERHAKGLKRLKRGSSVPVAVAMPEVRLRKRTNVFGVVKRGLPEIVAAIESEIARNPARGR